MATSSVAKSGIVKNVSSSMFRVKYSIPFSVNSTDLCFSSMTKYSSASASGIARLLSCK